MNKGPFIHVSNLSAFTKEKRILEGLNFECFENQKIALIGANGAGKTTLLRCLMRLIAFEGSITIHGRAIQEFSKKQLARKIAYAPQQIPKNIPFTVCEFLQMARFSNERTDLATNQSSLHFIEPILNQTGLREIAHRPISSLSGGERQRANIAAALAQDAPMLVLDEPYAHLDPAQQASIHNLLKEISTQKKLSLLIATHDLNWISEHCERIIALKNGKIIFDQNPDFILKKPILEEIFETKFLITQHPEKKCPLILSNP